MNEWWTPIENKLPLTEWEGPDNIGICEEFLVTVEHDIPDPNDDPEVMLLWFDNRGNKFTTEPGGEIYEDTHDWHVTAWMKKPKAYGFKRPYYDYTENLYRM